MKAFKSFVIKEFYHIFRDKRTLLIMFGMPVAQLLLFGYVIKNEITDAQIAILDYSKDTETQRIINKIISSDYFRLAKVLDTENEIEAIFRKGKVKEVIVFEKDFAKNLKNNGVANIQLIADASEANTANLIVSYTSAIVFDYLQSLNAHQSGIPHINVEQKFLYNESLKSVHMFVPGTMAVILLLISAMLTSITLAREKEFGSMEILLVSPLKPIEIILGKVTPYFLLSIVNSVTIIAVGYFVFGMPIKGSLILLMAESMLFILMALTLGIFISTKSPDQQTALMFSMFALMLPSIVLSGFIYPIENMPKLLQLACNIVPPKYFIEILRNIMIKGTDFTFVWKDTLILLIMTIFFTVAGVKNFKVRLQ